MRATDGTVLLQIHNKRMTDWWEARILAVTAKHFIFGGKGGFLYSSTYWSHMKNYQTLAPTCIQLSQACVSIWLWMDKMRCSRVVRASDCQCRSRNSPRLDLSILRHSGIWGAADEAVWIQYIKKMKNKCNFLLFWSIIELWRKWNGVEISLFSAMPKPGIRLQWVAVLVLLGTSSGRATLLRLQTGPLPLWAENNYSNTSNNNSFPAGTFRSLSISPPSLPGTRGTPSTIHPTSTVSLFIPVSRKKKPSILEISGDYSFIYASGFLISR